MKKYLIPFFGLIIIGCNSLQNDKTTAKAGGDAKANTLFQYNIWAAFVNRVFDGSLTVKELKLKGDIGLGDRKSVV